MNRSSTHFSSRAIRALGGAGALCLALTVSGVPAHAAEAPVDLGTATSFAVLAGQSVTNTGASVVTGDLGVGPGTAVSGIPPLVLLGGVQHVADAVAIQAQSDLTTAYDSAAGRSTVIDTTGQDLGGRTFTSGVVEHTSGMELTGTVRLDAEGDPSAVFIFKAGSTLVTASNSTVLLVNGASPCNVYWQVGSSATLGTDTTFVGTVMALTSATLDTRASVQGRVLARNGSVTLDTNVITRPSCTTPVTPSPSTGSSSPSPTTGTASASPSVSPSTSTAPSPSATPTAGGNGGGNDGGGGNNGGGDNSGGGSDGGGNGGDGNGGDDGGGNGGAGDDSDALGGNGNGSDANGTGGDGTGGSSETPVVPTGHPETGLGGGASGGPGAVALWLLGAAALAAAALRWRRILPG